MSGLHEQRKIYSEVDFARDRVTTEERERRLGRGVGRGELSG